ncbi:hypothetical protein Lalb_Chr08g0233491 [Lupinus albus]|uniref:Uncharacterized protein n=1 Tax=Lupinus albus TaxID=3870 RepID=A0A6A4Q3I8_LUPAL|nr:hypothetical protein Lalb_Chr08g0233491 [Lupinus albus]
MQLIQIFNSSIFPKPIFKSVQLVRKYFDIVVYLFGKVFFGRTKLGTHSGINLPYVVMIRPCDIDFSYVVLIRLCGIDFSYVVLIRPCGIDLPYVVLN